MKSGKQRRKEIKERRRKKAESFLEIDTCVNTSKIPLVGAVKADRSQLEHNNTYGFLPYFYVDKAFVCRDCSSKEIWTAKQQKWWYEVIKADINSIAVRCLACRKIIQQEKLVQKQHMEEMAKKTPHPNEAFLKEANQNRRFI